ncbi:hypothetical protein AB0E59_11490 [Lentzea sp. NPDC034063]|uniref:hypothetical protein n=1 Tax=unclassified Lentzea TaxID=2643253 RepID=UPI00340170EF
MTAALALSLLAAPAASAESDFATITLTKVSGWTGPEGGFWYTRGHPVTRQKFDVDIKNVAGHGEQGLDLFISFPTDRLDVTSYAGSGWDCWDVNEGVGAEGIRCTQDSAIADQQAWPKLTVETKAFSIYTEDTIDVYAEAGGHAEVHAQQAFLIDTST